MIVTTEKPVLNPEFRILNSEKTEAALDAFALAVAAHDFLEIDGVIWAGEEFVGKKFEKDALKIDNHRTKTSYAMDISAIIEQDLQAVIEALESGVWQKLYGITRIVGYYSRTSNWNKSKLGELKDRHRGNYSVVQGAARGAVAPRE